MRDLNGAISEYKRRHASIVAISVDDAAESKLLKERLGVDFPILSDNAAKTITAYGVLMEGDKLAVPAVFVLRPDATIAWRYVSEFKETRPKNDVILKQLDDL